MSRRRRWTPVRGTASRVDDPKERLLLGALDLPLKAVFAGLRALGLDARPALPEPADVRTVLVMRLDRIGDVLMSLPALADLRAALPSARLLLAVGRWSADVARSAPVDELLFWSAPWAGRPDEGSESLCSLWRKARGLRERRPDLAIDLQGDIRAAILMRLTRARTRVGYANTGGASLLTHVVPLDETVSWVEQNRRAVALAVGGEGSTPSRSTSAFPSGGASLVLTEDDRALARGLLERLAIGSRRPLVGIHPSGGRRVKQWEPARWREVAARLQQEFGATILITGSAADRALASEIAHGLSEAPLDLTGRLTLRETMSLIAVLDLFLSPDTGPMHMACALGTPSVSVFGPSDPARYFSGGDGAGSSRHVVVRADLWCSPCNLIRKPPAECAGDVPPECLRLVTPDAVHAAAARRLREPRSDLRIPLP
jgi:ADP-heptose:LPS heptosyltransferase